MTNDNPNNPNQNIVGGDIHQDNRSYQSARDMFVTEHGSINIHHPAAQEITYPFCAIPHAQNPNFTGREAVLAELHTQLHQQQRTTVTQAIAGLGGVGKTQLVVEYAHRCKADYDIVAWLGADNELRLGNDVVILGQALQVVQPPVTDQNAAIQMVRRWLGSTDKRWLLLVDNADTLPPRTVLSCLPTTGNGHILITSRNPNWGSVGAVLRLDVFTPAEAEAFLQRRLGDVNAAACAALARTLGYFPLALEHAAAFIEEKQCGVAAYHTYFTEQRQQLWATLEPPNAYHATITTTWELAFQEIKKTTGAAEVLNLCAFLDAEAIPLELLYKVEERPNTFWGKLIHRVLRKPNFLWDDPLALDDAIAALRRYSLLERAGDTLTIHRMVQTVVRDQMGAARHEEWLNIAVDLVADTWSFDPQKMETWQTSADILPHLISVTQFANEANTTTNRVANLNNETGFYLQHFGNNRDARPYYERALAIREQVLGDNHPHTATSLNNMGYLLRAMGELAAARPYYERALAINEQVLGVNHPHTASSLNNMGGLLDSMGELEEALPYYERAFAIRTLVLGDNHPDTAISLNNLGGLLGAIGEYKEALPYVKQALSIWERQFDSEHPNVGKGNNHIGFLLTNMEKYEEARPYYERALAINEQVLGENHPDTATNLNNMGSLLQAMGELATARPYYERALAIYEQMLGANHPNTATSLNNMGGLLRAMGELAAARPYFERALAIYEEKLGANHPNTKIVRDNLASLDQELSSSE